MQIARSIADIRVGKPYYLDRLPKTAPVGSILVHNHVRPTRRLGFNGFRAWLDHPDSERRVACDCGFAPELGTHYRVAGAGGLS